MSTFNYKFTDAIYTFEIHISFTNSIYTFNLHEHAEASTIF